MKQHSTMIWWDSIVNSSSFPWVSAFKRDSGLRLWALVWIEFGIVNFSICQLLFYLTTFLCHLICDYCCDIIQQRRSFRLDWLSFGIVKTIKWRIKKANIVQFCHICCPSLNSYCNFGLLEFVVLFSSAISSFHSTYSECNGTQTGEFERINRQTKERQWETT